MLLRPCSVRSSMHIYGIKEGLLQEFLGRRVLADVVYLGGGAGEVGVERGMQLSQGRGGQVQAYWVFKIKKYNWRQRRERKADYKKNIHLLFYCDTTN